VYAEVWRTVTDPSKGARGLHLLLPNEVLGHTVEALRSAFVGLDVDTATTSDVRDVQVILRAYAQSGINTTSLNQAVRQVCKPSRCKPCI
jgi:hypothetical protein